MLSSEVEEDLTERASISKRGDRLQRKRQRLDRDRDLPAAMRRHRGQAHGSRGHIIETGTDSYFSPFFNGLVLFPT